MFAHGVRDIIKPLWVSLMEQCKIHGSVTIPFLVEKLDMSYMGVKQQCEALHKLGYLDRLRVARTEVGRPEISYRLSAKSDTLFPQAGTPFTLELLQLLKPMFGDNAPEKILRHYFEEKKSQLLPRMLRAKSIIEKATLLTAMREKDGCFCRCAYEAGKGLRIQEFHHPLWAVFSAYPSAVQMELRMMEELLGSRLERREISAGRSSVARVEFLIPTI